MEGLSMNLIKWTLVLVLGLWLVFIVNPEVLICTYIHTYVCMYACVNCPYCLFSRCPKPCSWASCASSISHCPGIVCAYVHTYIYSCIRSPVKQMAASFVTARPAVEHCWVRLCIIWQPVHVKEYHDSSNACGCVYPMPSVLFVLVLHVHMLSRQGAPFHLWCVLFHRKLHIPNQSLM